MNSVPNIEPYTIEEYNPNQQPQQQQYIPQDYNQPFVEEPQNNKPRFQLPKTNFPFFLVIIALVVIGLLALGFLLLTSRNGGGNGDKNPDVTPTNVVLQFRGAFLNSEVIQPLLDEYKDLNPNVTIQYADTWPGGSFEQAEKAYQTELNRIFIDNESVEIPDIFMVNNTWAGDYENFSQSSTVFTPQAYASTFYPAATTDFTFQGNVYGVPLWMDTLAIVYNKDMLNSIQKAQPDSNWSAFKLTAEKLTIVTNGIYEQAGFAGGTANNNTFAFEIINLLLRQNGVQIVDANNQPIFSNDISSVEAFEFYRSFASGSRPTWSRNINDPSAAFLEERVAMIAIPSWRLRDIIKYNDENDIGIDIGIAQMPQIVGQDLEVINWATYWGAMVGLNRPDANRIESWKFLEWLSQPEQQLKLHGNIKSYYGYFGNLYTRQDMQAELEDDEYLKVYNESLPYAESWYMVKGREVEELFEETINAGATSSATLRSLEEDIKELLAFKGNLTE